MRIVYCTPSLYLAGGVERVLTTKVNYLADVAGHDVTVILTDGADKKPFYELSNKVKVVQLDIGFERMWNRPIWEKAWIYMRGMRRYKKALRQTLMELKADIVVSTLRREINFICDIPDGSRKIGELHVTRTHYRNFEANENNLLKQCLSNRWSQQLVEKVRGLDALVVLTPHEVTLWPELNNVRCIPNPLPFPIASDEEIIARNRPSGSEGSVICVGRYSYQKGIDLMLEAWAEVSKLHPQWRLDIYGSGDRTPYQQQAAALGLLPNSKSFESPVLRLLPASDNIRNEYLSHDIYALSSRFEGFGMVIIEAQACGLPVVTFDCPIGPRELVDNGQTGLLVANEDVASMAYALNKLITEKALREQLSTASRKAVVKFDVQHVMLQWLHLFAELKSL